jgi:hypothetical protein
MKTFGIRKSYLLALVFFVIPVGGLYLYEVTLPSGYSFKLSMDGGNAVVEECKEVSGYDNYLNELNKINKINNIICEFSGDLTTMSKGIRCSIMNGAVVTYFYWAENLNECNRIKSKIKQ